MSGESYLEELPIEVCLQLLRAGSVGRIAVMRDEYPLVVPVNYRLVEASARRWVAFRTRRGNVLDEAPMHAAFQIDGIDHVHRQGWAVLARGTLHHVDPDAADFRERFDTDSWLGAERDSWLVLEPFSITGRELRGAAPEWAFETHAYL